MAKEIMAKEKVTINKVTIHMPIDEYPDISWLGEYTEKWESGVLCRHCERYYDDIVKEEERRDEIEEEIYSHNDFLQDEESTSIDPQTRKNVEQEIESLEKELDNIPVHDCPQSRREYNNFKPYAGGEKEGTDEYKAYGLQDYKRIEGLERGDWCFIAVYAEAEVQYQTDSGSFRIERLQSGGIWGVESDSGSDYLMNIVREELSDLRSHLEMFKVDLSNFDDLAEEAIDQLDI